MLPLRSHGNHGKFNVLKKVKLRLHVDWYSSAHMNVHVLYIYCIYEYYTYSIDMCVVSEQKQPTAPANGSNMLTAQFPYFQKAAV